MSQPRSRLAALAALLALVALLPPAAAAAPTAWSVDGTVTSMARVGGTLYIGGQFSRLGATTGPAVLVARADGLPTGRSPRVEGTAGRFITSAIADGAGGAYVAGDFLSVDGVGRVDVAHVLADGSLDPAFAVATDASAVVYGLALAGDDLYLGGTFTSVNGTARSRIARVDATTGALAAWNPGADDVVRAFLVEGGTVFVGGQFGTIGGQARSRVAELSTTTGAPTAFDPDVTNAALASSVLAIERNGASLVLGGSFGAVGGEPRKHLASVSATSGAVTSWDPQPNSIIRDVLVAGGVVYAAGNFEAVGTLPTTRKRLAAWDATTGAVTSWNPAADGGSAHALALDGGELLVGGEFSTMGGQPRNGAAAVTLAGTLTAWDPNLDGAAFAVVPTGDRVLLAGTFTSAGGVDRANLAALDVATGRPTAWDPGATGVVSALAVAGDRVYVGGDFTAAGGQPRSRVAALDRTTGAALPWNPGADEQVLSIAANASTVWVGGRFGTVGGEARQRIAAIDATTGATTAWNPTAQTEVLALALSGATLYVGGAFGGFGGEDRARIAAVDVTTGAVTAFAPQPPAGAVRAIAATPDAVYVGGTFTEIGGAARTRIAALAPATGTATAWNPGADGEVLALAVEGDLVYAGGAFATVGGVARPHAVAIDRASGAPTSWDPAATDDVWAIAPAVDVVGLGGTFNAAGALPSSGVGLVDPSRVPPRFPATPTIAGVAAVGRTLTAAAAATGRPQPTTTLAWLRCDAAGSACTAIPGATATTYVPTLADIDARLVVRATATSVEATGSATSAPTAAVVPVAATRVSPTVRGVPSIGTGTTSLPVRCTLDQAGLRACTATLLVGGRAVATVRGTAAGAATRVDLALPVDAALRRLQGLADGRRASLRLEAAQAGRSGALVASVPVVLTRKGIVNATTDARFRGTRLRPDALLRELRAALVGARSIACTGHTDSRGAAAANRTRGLARAQAICRYLKGATGLRTSSASRGEAAPRATNATSAGRARNRYVAIRVRY